MDFGIRYCQTNPYLKLAILIGKGKIMINHVYTCIMSSNKLRYPALALGEGLQFLTRHPASFLRLFLRYFLPASSSSSSARQVEQIECQNTCQIQCQRICQIGCQSVIRSNVRQNAMHNVRQNARISRINKYVKHNVGICVRQSARMYVKWTASICVRIYVKSNVRIYCVPLYIYTPNRRSVGGDHSTGAICWLYIHICYIIYACLYHSKLP